MVVFKMCRSNPASDRLRKGVRPQDPKFGRGLLIREGYVLISSHKINIIKFHLHVKFIGHKEASHELTHEARIENQTKHHEQSQFL